jgi:hypothetical protein
LIGKTVQFRRGPAAVTGDESREMPLPDTEQSLSVGWEGAVSRMIRKPEDLLSY